MSSQESSSNSVLASLSTVASYLRLPFLASTGIAAVASGLLYFKQNELIYPRNLPIGARTEVPRPSDFGMTDWEDLTIPTPDGQHLNAFFIKAKKSPMAAAAAAAGSRADKEKAQQEQRKNAVTVLMFHGNAGNIGHRIPIAQVLQTKMSCHVLMLEYRGYGLSTGTPDEQGLMIDAQTGLDYIRRRPETRDSRIVVYGQSLGGAVAIQLVARRRNEGKVDGLILENTFTSMRKLIPSVMPPAKFLVRLCHEEWASDTYLPLIKNIPILFLSGLKDEIIPPFHMTQLFDLCKSPIKVWRPFPKGTHNETVIEHGYFEAFAEFVRDRVINAGSSSLLQQQREQKAKEKENEKDGNSSESPVFVDEWKGE